jgi:hypothetical protein
MQVRIHRHEPVERLRQEASEGARRHRLASLEALVLAHVRQVCGDQPHLAGAEFPGGLRKVPEAQCLRVRISQRRNDDDVLPGQVLVQAQVGLAVRKAARLDAPNGRWKVGREVSCRLFRPGGRQQQDVHGVSPIVISVCPEAYARAYSSSPIVAACR